MSRADPAAPRTGGQILIDALLVHGVDHVFCVPGESFLAALDALRDATNRIRTVTCRHEGGAACMAEAYGKLTGRPGVAMVTRGPGACNASLGVHIAQQDSTPMVIFIGQVERGHSEREAFQELDYRRFYGPLCKWAAQVESADRLPELVSQAFHRACAGRPGPVALALPEDMLRDVAGVADTGPYQVVQPAADPGAIEQLRQRLTTARRPFMIVGGPGWTAQACRDICTFAAANRIPTGASFRAQDRFDNTHECYAGELGLGPDPALSARVREADVLLAVGVRLGELTTAGYTLVEPPCPSQSLVHVYPDPDELGRVFQPELAVCAGVASFARAAADIRPVAQPRWDDWTRDARADYLDNLQPTPGLPGSLEMGAVMAQLRQRLPPNAILTTDAGNFSGWMHRHYLYRAFPTQLGPTNGAMGYGVPAAVAARLLHPDRPVVAFCGDGGALMSGQEIATAMHYGVDPVILVLNNAMYGTIRMHQQRDYPGREHATALTNPDFAAWARSFGAYARAVERTEEFGPALDEALHAGRVAVLELRIDPELISTRARLSEISKAP